ncbi:D-amino-acid transaminase [Bacillus tuaregi]|uniref:D-amino-acid transaminase n=1 Tax=Bacillus tuaregi TaxID=1816695 RepID=UPI0008F92845|nr:D-amino-acid transaminase [Bacillus tuaregi]
MEIGYINGNYIGLNEKAVPIEERGQQFGDGIYEVIRVYNGKAFMLQEHLERLIKSGNAIKLPIKQKIEDFRSLINEAIVQSGLTDSCVYLQITRGISARNHLFPDVPISISMTVKPIIPLAKSIRENGASAIFHDDERWANCYIKSLNLLPNVLARQTAYEQNCVEAILVRDGMVTEGTSSNVFIVKQGKVYTAPLSRYILAGITRVAVKNICEAESISFIEQSFSKEVLTKADEVFITNTTSEIVPIVEVEGHMIGTGRPGEVSRKLYNKLQQLVADLKE